MDVIVFVLLGLFGVSIEMSIEPNSSSLFLNSSSTLELSPSHCKLKLFINCMCNLKIVSLLLFHSRNAKHKRKRHIFAKFDEKHQYDIINTIK